MSATLAKASPQAITEEQLPECIRNVISELQKVPADTVKNVVIDIIPQVVYSLRITITPNK